MKTIKILLLANTLLFSCSSHQSKNEKYQSSILLQRSIEHNLYALKKENNDLCLFLSEFEESKDAVNRIRELRDDTAEELNEIRESLISFCGGRDEDMYFINIENKDAVKKFFVNNGHGNKLEKALNSYYHHNMTQEKIVFDIKETALNDIPEYKGKTFFEVFFGDTNLISALNQISVLELEFYIIESIILKEKLLQIIEKSM